MTTTHHEASRGRVSCRLVAIAATTWAAVALAGCAGPIPVATSPQAPSQAPITTATLTVDAPQPSATPASRTVTLTTGDPVGSDVECRTAAGSPCSRLRVTTQGFVGSYTCAYFDDQQSTDPWLTLTFTGEETNQKAYYGFPNTVWVVCDGVVSNKVPW